MSLFDKIDDLPRNSRLSIRKRLTDAQLAEYDAVMAALAEGKWPHKSAQSIADALVDEFGLDAPSANTLRCHIEKARRKAK